MQKHFIPSETFQNSSSRSILSCPDPYYIVRCSRSILSCPLFQINIVLSDPYHLVHAKLSTASSVKVLYKTSHSTSLSLHTNGFSLDSDTLFPFYKSGGCHFRRPRCGSFQMFSPKTGRILRIIWLSKFLTTPTNCKMYIYWRTLKVTEVVENLLRRKQNWKYQDIPAL